MLDAEIGAAAPVGRPTRDDEKGDNVTISTRGNDPVYALRRLKRDRPDLAERVVAGELSANAAAIEAGFRRKPTQLETLQRACRMCRSGLLVFIPFGNVAVWNIF